MLSLVIGAPDMCCYCIYAAADTIVRTAVLRPIPLPLPTSAVRMIQRMAMTGFAKNEWVLALGCDRQRSENSSGLKSVVLCGNVKPGPRRVSVGDMEDPRSKTLKWEP